MLGNQPEDFAILSGDQFLRGGREHNVDSATIDIVIDDFEKARAAAQSFGPGKFGISGEVLELNRIDVVSPGKRVRAMPAGLGLGRFGAADFGETR